MESPAPLNPPVLPIPDSTDNLSSVQTTTYTSSKRSKFNKVIPVIVLTLLFIILGTVSYLLYQKSTENSQTDVALAPTDPSGNAQNYPQLVYISSNRIWSYFSDGSKKEIPVDEQKGVSRFSYNPNKGLLAYTQGAIIESGNDLSYTVADSAYLYNFATDTSYSLYRDEAVKNENSGEYESLVKDVGISSDGEWIAITTSDTILLHNVSTKKTEEVYKTATPQTGRVSMVYAYSTPKFSQDNSKLLITKLFYEGAQSCVFDRSTGELVDIPGYSYYVSGKLAVDWLNNNEIIAIEYESLAASDRPYTTLMKTSFPSFEETLIVNFDDQQYNYVSFRNNRIFLILEKRLPTQTEINGVPIHDSLQTVNSYSLATGELVQLYDSVLKSNTAGNKVTYLNTLYVPADPMQIYIGINSHTITTKGSSSVEFSVHQLNTKSGVLSKIIDNASLQY